jgi:thiosulfate reductase cytochrome b subunit
MNKFIYRHSVVVRASHALNGLSLAVLLMSGLQIFNAHPALYWGERSDFERPVFSIANAVTSDGRPVGMTSVMGRQFDTTGVLGWSRLNRRPVARAFPAWMTLPRVQDLATGRIWHFFFAWVFFVNGLVYLAHSIVSAHLRRDLVPRREQWARIGRTVRQLFTFKHGANDGTYNVIQRLSYLAVVLLLAPLAALTGLAMSPGLNAAMPWLPDIFGGRQSARTLHFTVTWILVAFAIVHVLMVVLSGLFNNIRSIVTGWYTVRHEVSSS